MTAPYRISGNSFSSGTPKRWPTTNIFGGQRLYTVAPDGKSVIMLVSNDISPQQEQRVSVLLNFFDEVRRRAGGEY
jgi:hypothetical protein